MIRTRLIVVLLVYLAAPISAHAFSLADWWQNKTWHPLVSIGGGTASSSNVGASQNFPIQYPVTEEFYSYSVSHATQTSSLVDIFLGAEWNVQPNWAVQGGIGYNQASPFSVKGTLVQGTDVASQNTYTYQYGVLIRQLLIEGKLLYSFRQRFHPYVFAGLGTALNKSYSYNTNVPPFLTFTRMYSNNAMTSFSYALGVGLDYDVDSLIRLGIGYRFANLGKAQLGSAVIDTTHVSGTLSQSNIYANEVLVQFTLMA